MWHILKTRRRVVSIPSESPFCSFLPFTMSSADAAVQDEPQKKTLLNQPQEGVHYPLKVHYCGGCVLFVYLLVCA